MVIASENRATAKMLETGVVHVHKTSLCLKTILSSPPPYPGTLGGAQKLLMEFYCHSVAWRYYKLNILIIWLCKEPMWFVWNPCTAYYKLIRRHLMQLSIYNGYERHYVLLLPSQMVWVWFMYIWTTKKLRWPRRAHLISYLWVTLHNTLWKLVVVSLVIIH